MAAQRIRLLQDKLAIVRYDRADPMDLEFDGGSGFFSMIRTDKEVSLVMDQKRVPRNAPRKSTGWRLFEVEGPFPFDAVGILASVTAPLADAGVSIFALATFDTDYFLVQGRQLRRAVAALKKAGHTVSGPGI